MTPTTRLAERDDAPGFIAAMSEFDRSNIETIGEPVEVLHRVIDLSSHTFYAEADEPLFLGGMIGAGDVWMLATPAVERHRKFYLRETLRQVGYMLMLQPRLQTQVDERYTKSLRWLRWLGFTMGERIMRGDVALRRVERVRDHV